MGGVPRQAQALEKHLGSLPNETEVMDLEAQSALPFFQQLGAPWIVGICDRYNVGGIKFLGGEAAPAPQFLARFLNNILDPEIRSLPEEYPPILAEAVREGYLALRERMGGEKRIFGDTVEFFSALAEQGLEMAVADRPVWSGNVLKGYVRFEMEGANVQAQMDLRLQPKATLLMLITQNDYVFLTRKFNQLLGNWDFKFSNGNNLMHVWHNGPRPEEVARSLSYDFNPQHLIGINSELIHQLIDIDPHLMSKMAARIKALTSRAVSPDELAQALMFLNLGRLRWIMGEVSN
jgi:DNA-binding transcriptional regulator YdaS (Cro superfamily)